MLGKNKFIIVFIISFILFFTSCNNDILKNDIIIQDNIVIKIGVPMLDNENFRYDILKSDLENKLNIEIEYIDLYAGLDDVISNDTYIERIDNLLKNNEIDICLGVPSYQLEKIIGNDRLLNITDSILEIEKIHKGVVDISRKMGSGNLYFVSPIISNIYLVFQNKLILNDLDSKLPTYVSWNEFLRHLNDNQNIIENKNLDYYPIALAVKNFGEDNLFIGYQFFLQALGLGEKIIEDNKFTQSTIEYYKVFSKIVSDYGKGYESFENGKYPKDYIFINGNYVYMLGEAYDLESFFNSDLNNIINKNSPLEIKVDFPVEISFINFDGSKTQNLRDTTIFINKNTDNKELCINILNTLLSKEYANKIIENRSEYSHFTSSRFAYPTYYDNDTITALNKKYDGKFDISLLYDVEYGNVIYNNDIDMKIIINLLNDEFTKVYNTKENYNMDSFLEDSIKNMEEKFNLSN